VPKGETDAETPAAVAQRMGADGIGRRPRRWAWRLDQQVSNHGLECARSVIVNEIARTGVRTMLRNRLKQPRDHIDRIRGCDRTDRRGARRIAAEPHMPPRKSGAGAQANVGPDGIEMQRRAAIDHDGDFRSQLGREGSRGNPLAQCVGEVVGVNWLVGLNAGERIGENRDAVACVDTERRHRVGENGADAGVKPRIWMLPRAVTSMIPLP